MITSGEARIILGWWHVVKAEAEARGWAVGEDEKEVVKKLRKVARPVKGVIGTFEWAEERKEIVKDE